MRTHRGAARVCAFLGATTLACAGSLVAQTPAQAPQPVTFTVTSVGGDKAPAISKADVQLTLGRNERTPVDGWAQDDKLALAILIDDSIGSSAAANWNGLRELILAQPATTLIAVGYLSNNGTRLAQDFTTNHQAAADALRIPAGRRGRSSPYLATMDLLRRWPNTGPRRSIILISSGFDYFRGRDSGSFFPDVVPLTRLAQTQNTNIWTVFFPSAGHSGGRRSEALTGQNNLARVADDTGGELFALGVGAPVSLQPHFDEIFRHLGSQYLLTFAAVRNRSGRHVRVDVGTEVPDGEFLTPAAVYVPAAK
jgi:hypothetical protein